MTALEMSEAIEFMLVFDPAGAARIQYAGKLAMRWACSWVQMDAECAIAACLVACEVQCIVEAMRAERAGGILIRRQGA